MIQDQEITSEQALVFAHMVLHDNAAKLYGFSVPQEEQEAGTLH